MQLSSPAFESNHEMPQKFGYKIENISPPLLWQDAPEGTKSFALSLLDKTLHPQEYVHWLVIDIPATATLLEEGAVGAGQMHGSREITGYAGPFPPSGTHEYEFTLYALGTPSLGLPPQASLGVFTNAVKAHSLDKATLLGRFTKQ